MSWQELIDGMKNDAATLLKSEIEQMLKSGKEDTSDFTKKQAIKVERYLIEFASGAIAKEQLSENMKDLESLTRMQINKLSVTEKAGAQRLADGIRDIIIKRLFQLL
ncbi:MAG: hypothetical protein NT145_04820 [Elusimicrobia bacterium]|nr:hypothetical protein [Elusimicrobiota bacterium]